MTVWHSKKLTTNQKKNLLLKKSTYYGEIGRKVDWIKRRKLQNMKTPAASFGRVATFEREATFGSKVATTLRRRVQQKNNIQLRSKQSESTTRLWHRTCLSKLKDSYNKKVWYLDKAAPIPGVNPKLSVGYAHKNKTTKKAFNSYRMFKNYMQTRSKKTMNKFFSSAYYVIAHTSNNQMARRNSREFTALIYLDSLYHSSLRKRAFKVKPKQNNIACVATRGDKKENFLLNGKYVRKNVNLVRSSRVRFQKGGDFFIAGSNNISGLYSALGAGKAPTTPTFGANKILIFLSFNYGLKMPFFIVQKIIHNSFFYFNFFIAFL